MRDDVVIGIVQWLPRPEQPHDNPATAARFAGGGAMVAAMTTDGTTRR